MDPNIPRCGDSKIDSDEACDQGDARNGFVCPPSYNKPCTYCSSDCKNVLEIKPSGYCGDGILQADKGELCEIDPATKFIWAASASSLTLGYPNKNDDHNGFQVETCEEASSALTDITFGYYSGVRGCTDCSVLVNSCVQCGPITADQGGVSVESAVINALHPNPPELADANNPLDIVGGVNFDNLGTDWNHLDALNIFSASWFVVNNNPAALSKFYLLRAFIFC